MKFYDACRGHLESVSLQNFNQNFMKSNLILDKLNKNFFENVCLLSHFQEVASTYKCLLYLVTSFLETQ